MNKKVIVLSGVLTLVVLSSISLTSSFSQSPLNDIAEKMTSSAGPSTIKISGESSKKIPQDASRLAVAIMTKPTDLSSLEEQRKSQIDKAIKSINDSIGENNVSITTGYTYYNPQWSNGSPDMSSISAHIEIPVKVKINDVAAASKIISEKGFWVNNLQIQKVPKPDPSKSDTSTSTVSIPFGTATPGCESTNECFLPHNNVVTMGQTVSWENLDSAAHTVTSGTPNGGPDGTFDSALFMAGTTFSHTFDYTGKFDYFCLVHPWMVGKITVVQGDAPTNSEPVEYVYQASLMAVIDLPPDTIDNSVATYQEKLLELEKALASYQLEDKNSRQGQVYFNPTYWPSSMSNVFTSNTQLLIEVDYDKIENVLKAIKNSGTNFESFSLTYSAEALESVRKELTQEAIENAKERALEIITPMGLQIKGIKSIEVKSSNFANQYGNTPIYSNGVMLRMPYYDSNQINEAFVIVDIEFEVGK